MKTRLKKINLRSLLLALALLGTVVSTGAAQSQTVLFVTPELTEVPLGNQMEMTVEVYLGLNINAFDLTLTYDQDVLTLDDWEYGDYLSNLANIKVEDEPGRLRIAATQLAKPAVSGDGELLRLTFDTVAPGISEIEWVEAILADSQGNKTEPVLGGGSVEVIVAPTFTPTLTPTQTATPKPTITPQPTTGDDAYPVKEEPTATGTQVTAAPTDDGGAAQGITATDAGAVSAAGGDGSDSGASGQDGNLSGGSEEQNPGDAPQGAAGEESANPENATLTPSNQVFLNILLWIVLLLGVVVLVVMMVVAIRRPKRKHEDYLL